MPTERDDPFGWLPRRVRNLFGRSEPELVTEPMAIVSQDMYVGHSVRTPRNEASRERLIELFGTTNKPEEGFPARPPAGYVPDGISYGYGVEFDQHTRFEAVATRICFQTRREGIVYNNILTVPNDSSLPVHYEFYEVEDPTDPIFIDRTSHPINYGRNPGDFRERYLNDGLGGDPVDVDRAAVIRLANEIQRQNREYNEIVPQNLSSDTSHDQLRYSTLYSRGAAYRDTQQELAAIVLQAARQVDGIRAAERQAEAARKAEAEEEARASAIAYCEQYESPEAVARYARDRERWAEEAAAEQRALTAEINADAPALAVALQRANARFRGPVEEPESEPEPKPFNLSEAINNGLELFRSLRQRTRV